MRKYIVAVGIAAKDHFDSFDEAKGFANGLIEDGMDARIDWLFLDQPASAITYRYDPELGDWVQTGA
jgi:hypothetical protein